MNHQEVFNCFKRSVSKLFDLRIKKDLGGLTESDKKELANLKTQLKDIADTIEANGHKCSVIQQSLSLANALINELEKEE